MVPASRPRATRRAPGTVERRVARAVDPRDRAPVYEQIAAVIRWEIGMGRCSVGDVLPAIRHLAATLGVNYHTVRRAYEVLIADGVVASRRGGGTVVRRLPRREAQEARRAFVVECNITDAGELVRDIDAAYHVTAVPWLLRGQGEPPPGAILGTRFHESEMRRLWPRRRNDIQIIEREVDPAIPGVITAIAESLTLGRLVVVERDLATAREMARELKAQLSPLHPPVDTAAPRDPDVLMHRVTDALVVFAPRVWDRLRWTTRSNPRALLLRFSARPESLREVAADLGWPHSGAAF
jgi:DNA-binding transcriptional regulator YhcF (GntR family)